MKNCPCGSTLLYTDCCEPAHLGVTSPKTAEALMRSRYSAYVVKNITYLGDTLHPEHNDDWDETSTRSWANAAEWVELEIIATEKGQENDDEGTVEFAASFKEGLVKKRHHEISYFKKSAERWYYVDGSMPKVVTHRNEGPKVGRNSPCPCGSGKKFKKCCFNKS